MKFRGFMAILLLVTVIVFVLYIVKTGEKGMLEERVDAFDRAKHQLTETNMQSLERLITMYSAERGALPRSLDDLSVLGPMTTGKKDAWSNEIKYERISDMNFRLTSSGADLKFGTEDDIVKEY
ncbi:MAG: type II secretion system protein GspG [Candidatus Aminicenantaceae bacterium]